MAKEKFYHAWAKATSINGDEHYVTVVGKFTQNYVPKQVTQEVPVEVKPAKRFFFATKWILDAARSEA